MESTGRIKEGTILLLLSSAEVGALRRRRRGGVAFCGAEAIAMDLRTECKSRPYSSSSLSLH